MSLESASTNDLGISEEEMHSFMESLRTGKGDEGRQICICGHAIARHSKSEALSSCSVGRSWCSCSQPFPILESDDLRAFIFSTDGIGKKHALAKGLYALWKNGRKARWLINLACFRCERQVSRLFPAALTREKRIAFRSGYSNALLCRECAIELGGSMYDQ